MLPLIKRSSTAHEGRARRDRGLAAPARIAGTWLRPENFEPGCEVLVPREDAKGKTFLTWCKVLRVDPAGYLWVDVPEEVEQRVGMQALQRVAEQQRNGPAGSLLSQVHSLQKQLEQERAARLKAELQLRPLSLMAPPEPEAPSVPPSPTAMVVYRGGGEGKTCCKCGRDFASERGRKRHEHRFCRGPMVDEANDVYVAAAGDASDNDAEEVIVMSGWAKLNLQCQFTLERLHDPAKLIGCKHLPCTNFDALRSAGKVCPVYGCDAPLRLRNIVRATALQKKLQRIPGHIEHVWISGEDLVRTTPPSRAEKRQRCS